MPNLADISGAFDRVSRCLLLGKLQQLGVPGSFLDFLNAYLNPREGIVTVEGAYSDAFCLSDMVFQGTVLGPALWNAFFGDIAHVVPVGSQQVNLFADDLNGVCVRSVDLSNEILSQELAEMQNRAHRWGMQNRVTLDPSKEYLKILHPLDHEGEDFKLLGSIIDCSLSMKPCINFILSKVRPKVKAMLRLKDMYSIHEMLNFFKSHI